MIQMIRTALAPLTAQVVAGARPCGGFGHGYQWRNRSMADMKSTNATTKRHPRHLGIATT